VGSLVDRVLGPLFLVLTVALVLRSIFWHIRPLKRFRWSRFQHQASRPLSELGIPGLVYFGAILGVGIATEMSTPLVQAGAMGAIWGGAIWGAVYGACFGIGRSSPLWSAALSRDKSRSPASIIEHYVGPLRRHRMRYLGVTAGVLYLAILGAEVFLRGWF
jgi:hypothetical protein